MASSPEILIAIIAIIVNLPQSLLAVIQMTRLWWDTSDRNPERSAAFQYQKSASSERSSNVSDQSSSLTKAPCPIQGLPPAPGNATTLEKQIQTPNRDMSNCHTSSTRPTVSPATVRLPLPTHHSTESRCLCSC